MPDAGNKLTDTVEHRLAELEHKVFILERKEAGRNINPATAEVFCIYGDPLDPYGIYPDLPEEYRWSGKNCFAPFAPSPGSNIWVEFGDLPEATRNPRPASLAEVKAAWGHVRLAAWTRCSRSTGASSTSSFDAGSRCPP